MFRRCTLALTLAFVALTAGCHAQQVTPVPIIAPPAVTSTAFSQLNLSTPTSALTYTDLPTTGSFCYFVQTFDSGGVSAASNVVCLTTTSALKHALLSWSAPASGCQGTCSYVVSRAAAVLSPVGVPTMQAPVNTAGFADPARQSETLAKNEIHLTIRGLK